MGLKIRFYASIKNAENVEVDLLKYYQNKDEGYCIYCIKAAEICSEFIARYFHKVVAIPDILMKQVMKENYDEKEYYNAVYEISNGIYKANTEKMVNDNKLDYEFKTFKECKIVREKLLNKYEEIGKILEKHLKEAKVELYAYLTV